MNLERILLAAVATLFFCRSAAAALPADGGQVFGTGSIQARALVSGITTVGSAIAEAKSKRPDPKAKADPETLRDDGDGDEPKPAPPPQAKLDPAPPEAPAKSKAALPSRLEVVAGADRLLATTDVFKQASLSAEARYRLSDHLQLGLSAGVRTQGDDISRDAAAQLLFGPIFNFGTGEGLINSFFFSPKAGVTAERVTRSDSVLRSGAAATLALSAGKRFGLSDSVAWAPSVDVVKQAGYDPCFAVVPVAFAIFF